MVQIKLYLTKRTLPANHHGIMVAWMAWSCMARIGPLDVMRPNSSVRVGNSTSILVSRTEYDCYRVDGTIPKRSKVLFFL